MKTLTFTAPHDLAQLHDELIAALPALADHDEHQEEIREPDVVEREEAAEGVVGSETVRPGAVRQVVTVREPRLRVEGTGDAIALAVPDDADEAAIAAVVEAHVPRERTAEPTLNERLAAALQPLLAKPALSGADLAPLVALLREGSEG